MQITEELVTTKLAGHLPALHAMVSGATSKVRQMPPTDRLELSQTAIAMLVHDYFVAEAYRYAEQRGDVQMLDINHMALFVTQSGVAVRLKKVDEDFIPSGHITKQFRRFRSQEDMDGLPTSIHVDLVYQLDAACGLAGVYVVLPAGPRSNYWVSRIDGDDLSPVVVNLFPSDPTAPEITGGSVVPKPKKIDDETESGDGDSWT